MFDTKERQDRYQDYLHEKALIIEEQREHEAKLEAQVNSAIQFDIEKAAAKCELLEEREWVEEFENLGLVSKGTTSKSTETPSKEGYEDIAHLLWKRKSTPFEKSFGNLTPKRHHDSHLFPKAQKAHLFHNLKLTAWDRAHSSSKSQRLLTSGMSSNPM